MKNLKKVLACIMAVATLGCVSATGVSADIIDSDGNNIKTIYLYDEDTIGQEQEIELSTGEKITLPKWAQILI